MIYVFTLSRIIKLKPWLAYLNDRSAESDNVRGKAAEEEVYLASFLFSSCLKSCELHHNSVTLHAISILNRSTRLFFSLPLPPSLPLPLIDITQIIPSNVLLPVKYTSQSPIHCLPVCCIPIHYNNYCIVEY